MVSLERAVEDSLGRGVSVGEQRPMEINLCIIDIGWGCEVVYFKY